MQDEPNKQLPARIEDVADVMLEQTASSTKLLRFNAQTLKYLIGEDEVPLGHEYVAYPFDAMRGFILFKDGEKPEQRIGLIRDRFNLQREGLPADEDWKPQVVLPLEDLESGAVVAFVSNSTGGKIGVETLIQNVGRAVKAGRGTATPVIKLAISTFKSGYGMKDRPEFVVVNEPMEVVPKKADFNDTIPY